jgi:signal peptidase
MLFVMIASRNGWQFAAVLSGSMEPVYNVGGLVVIKPVDNATLKTGDVISFNLPGIDTPICHRIIDIRYLGKQELFQTKGDANEEPDWDMVPISDVKGKVVFFTPYVGRLVEIKKIGATEISLLGQSLPLAVLVITVMGLLFIGLTLKEMVEDIFWPGKRWQRETHKKRQQLVAKRRKAFYLS